MILKLDNVNATIGHRDLRLYDQLTAPIARLQRTV
jgi:hypothetical protein